MKEEKKPARLLIQKHPSEKIKNKKKKQQNKIEAYPRCFGTTPKLSFHF